MKKELWRLFEETGLTQAYMLYRSEQEEREEASKDEHHGRRGRPQIGKL